MILAPSILASDRGHLDDQIAAVERYLDAFADAGAAAFAGGDPEAAVRSLLEAARPLP